MQDINRPEIGVKEYFDQLLKKLKIDFVVEGGSGNHYYYRLYIGSAYGNIQLELSDKLDSNEICYQTWVTLEEDNYEQFSHNVFWVFNWDEIESNIEELINSVKNIIRIKGKIDNHLDSIRELIDQSNLGLSFDLTAEDVLR